MITALLVAILVVGLAGGVGTAYYRSRALGAEKALKLLTEIGAQWRAANAQLQDRVVRAETALKDAHARESAADAETSIRAAGDARLASDLLNQLPQPGGGDAAGSGAEVRPGPTTPASDRPVVPVRKL